MRQPRVTLKEWKPSRPTFKGRHNSVKAKCLIVLYEAKMGHQIGPTAKELAAKAGVSYRSLSTLLPRWLRWEFVLCEGTYRVQWRIARRGQQWLNRWQSVMPLVRYVREIEALSIIIEEKEERDNA